MHKKFEMIRTKIKGSCQSERRVITHDSKSNLPLNLVTTHLKITQPHSPQTRSQLRKQGVCHECAKILEKKNLHEIELDAELCS